VLSVLVHAAGIAWINALSCRNPGVDPKRNLSSISEGMDVRYHPRQNSTWLIL
jgi:hypothetical protein